MTPRWQDVRCASIPVADLSVLADLRREPGIRVTIARGRAWVCWDDGPASEVTTRILVGRLLPLAGVEIFVNRDGRWYRPGESLPAFHVPIGDDAAGSLLDRLILPQPLVVSRPEGDAITPVPLRLVRDESDRPRPATAVRCRLADLAGWAEQAPSSWIESLSAAWSGVPGEFQDGAEVLVLAAADPAPPTEPRPPLLDSMARTERRSLGRVRLPALEGGQRFWGCDVLIPLGFRTEPNLADRALRQAVGAKPDDLVILDDDGTELIPRQAFRPLSRAGIRLASSTQRLGPAPG
jgi:hypothetical protein